VEFFASVSSFLPIDDIAFWGQSGEFEVPYAFGDVLQALRNGIGVVAALLVIVGQDDDVGAAQMCGVRGRPFAGALRVARRANVPLCERVGFGLAFNYEHGWPKAAAFRFPFRNLAVSSTAQQRTAMDPYKSGTSTNL